MRFLDSASNVSSSHTFDLPLLSYKFDGFEWKFIEVLDGRSVPQ